MPCRLAPSRRLRRGTQLRTIVERIEHIEQEISELNEGKREIYQEAKSNGFDPKP
jgi:uncharacterized protein (UPF0335 family)